MPIDATIPLRTRTPQIQSPLDAYSRALHVRGQVQQEEALDPQEKRRRIDNANIQIVKLARQAIKTFRKAS